MQEEPSFQQSAEANDIEYTPTPTGFVARVSLSSYKSLLIIGFLFVFIAFMYFIFNRSGNTWDRPIEFLFPFVFVVIVGINLWRGFLQAVGTEIFTLDTPYLEIAVGIGRLLFRKTIDIRNITSVTIGEGTIREGKYGPNLKAILIFVNEPVRSFLRNKNKLAFGHYMTDEQKNFVLNRLKEAITQSGMGNTTFREM